MSELNQARPLLAAMTQTDESTAGGIGSDTVGRIENGEEEEKHGVSGGGNRILIILLSLL